MGGIAQPSPVVITFLNELPLVKKLQGGHGDFLTLAPGSSKQLSAP